MCHPGGAALPLGWHAAVLPLWNMNMENEMSYDKNFLNE
jgi:hypothetical protein